MVRRAALVLLLCAGCISYMDMLRGHDAYVREENAKVVLEAVEELRSGPTIDATAQEEILDRIEDAAHDETQRAEVAQVDHEWKPKKKIDPKSQETDAKFNEYTGEVGARDAKRRRRKALPGKIVRGVFGLVIGLIPKPIRIALRIMVYVSAVFLGGPVLIWMWRRARYFRKAAFEAIQGAKKLPREQRKKAFGDKPTLKDVYRKNGIK